MTQRTPIRVLVAHHYPMMRSVLRAVLGPEPDITVVGSADSGKKCVALAGEFKPDLAVIDADLDDLNGLEVAQRLRLEHPTVKVILLMDYAKVGCVRRATDAGVQGCVVSTETSGHLIAAIRTVMAGQTFFSCQRTEQHECPHDMQ